MEAGPGDGDLVQGQPLGEHRWGEADQVTTVHQPWPMRPAAPHRGICQGARPVLGLLCPHARYVVTYTPVETNANTLPCAIFLPMCVSIFMHTLLPNHSCTHKNDQHWNTMYTYHILNSRIHSNYSKMKKRVISCINVQKNMFQF